jgi:hypothetical protein
LKNWIIVSIVAVGTCALVGAQQTAGDRAPAPLRTPDGQPDLQGVWDYRTLTPLERPKQFSGRATMTPDEAAAYEKRAAERPDGRPPDDPQTAPSVHPPDWLDYGRHLLPDRRTSLIVDPPDGRIPALTPEAVARQAARRAASRVFGPYDHPENRSLWERCITRGVPEGLLPNAYNNNVEIIQTPGHVVLMMEMIHDARIVSLDGRPHAPPSMRSWMGDSVGTWDGNTLVVETTNFSERANFRGSGEDLHLIERFQRLDRDTLEYRFTVSDPDTWVQPWTVVLPMRRSTERLYEYACHEGNYSLRNILGQARALERAKPSSLVVPAR